MRLETKTTVKDAEPVQEEHTRTAAVLEEHKSAAPASTDTMTMNDAVEEQSSIKLPQAQLAHTGKQVQLKMPL